MEQLALQEIYPEILKIGAQLVAITPGKKPLPADHPLAQVAAQMGVGPEGEGRTFPVLWDEGNRVADLFGLTHDFSDATRDLYSGAGLDMEDDNIEFGMGFNVSMWGGLLSTGYGWNLMSDSRREYIFVGLDLLQVLGAGKKKVPASE